MSGGRGGIGAVHIHLVNWSLHKTPVNKGRKDETIVTGAQAASLSLRWHELAMRWS